MLMPSIKLTMNLVQILGCEGFWGVGVLGFWGFGASGSASGRDGVPAPV